MNKFSDWFFTWGLAICGFMMVALIIFSAFQSDLESQRIRSLCYAQGMVPADTEVGKICVDPKTMVRVK